MSNINVGLDCRNWAGTDNGYKDTTASDNTTVYSYKYSGGSDGNGNVTEYTDDGSGQGTITVTCGGDARYHIQNITFNGDDHHDLSWAPGPAANVAIITDTNIDNENVYFTVFIIDTSNNLTFGCDPDIINKPKPPQ